MIAQILYLGAQSQIQGCLCPSSCVMSGKVCESQDTRVLRQNSIRLYFNEFLKPRAARTDDAVPRLRRSQ